MFAFSLKTMLGMLAVTASLVWLSAAQAAANSSRGLKIIPACLSALEAQSLDVGQAPASGSIVDGSANPSPAEVPQALKLMMVGGCTAQCAELRLALAEFLFKNGQDSLSAEDRLTYQQIMAGTLDFYRMNNPVLFQRHEKVFQAMLDESLHVGVLGRIQREQRYLEEEGFKLELDDLIPRPRGFFSRRNDEENLYKFTSFFVRHLLRIPVNRRYREFLRWEREIPVLTLDEAHEVVKLFASKGEGWNALKLLKPKIFTPNAMYGEAYQETIFSAMAYPLKNIFREFLGLRPLEPTRAERSEEYDRRERRETRVFAGVAGTVVTAMVGGFGYLSVSISAENDVPIFHLNSNYTMSREAQTALNIEASYNDDSQKDRFARTYITAHINTLNPREAYQIIDLNGNRLHGVGIYPELMARVITTNKDRYRFDALVDLITTVDNSSQMDAIILDIARHRQGMSSDEYRRLAVLTDDVHVRSVVLGMAAHVLEQRH